MSSNYTKTYRSDDPNNSMTYRSLGRCGTKVSIFGLGGWLTYGGSIKQEQQVREIIQHAFEKGINFFDIADIYANGESEIIMGKALRDIERHRLVISSKTFWPMSKDINDRGLSRKHIMESVEKSLKRVGTDYFDVYFCHRFDPETPLEETIRAMDDLVHQGKILYWGTSEWTAGQLQDGHDLCRQNKYYLPQVEQPQYSLLVRKTFESEIAPTANNLGMGLVTWSPLASGMLTGKYKDGFNSGRLEKIKWLQDAFANTENLERIKKFQSLADREKTSPSKLALAWTASHPNISSVILGATSIEQLAENVSALQVYLSPELRKEIETIFAT